MINAIDWVLQSFLIVPAVVNNDSLTIKEKNYDVININYIISSKGPITHPCETPQVIGLQLEIASVNNCQYV